MKLILIYTNSDGNFTNIILLKLKRVVVPVPIVIDSGIYAYDIYSHYHGKSSTLCAHSSKSDVMSSDTSNKFSSSSRISSSISS